MRKAAFHRSRQTRGYRPWLQLLEDRTAPAVLVDFGDAPASYGTDAASHAVSGPFLGSLRDDEPAAQVSGNAAGDDAVSDDEDGVTLPPQFAAHGDAAVTVNASVGARLDAWIDWNHDGDFGDAGEQVADNIAIANANTTLSLAVPGEASVTSPTVSFARFRVSSAGNLGPSGAASDGEIEDYQIALVSPSDVYVDTSIAGLTVGQDPPGPATMVGYDAFADIQQAMNVVREFGTVHVAAGTYSQDLVIPKSLNLEGSGKDTTILSGPGGLTGILVNGHDAVSVSRLTVQNFATGLVATDVDLLELNDIKLSGNAASGSVNATSLWVRGNDSADAFTVTDSQIVRGNDYALDYSSPHTHLHTLGGEDTVHVKSLVAHTQMDVDTGAGTDWITVTSVANNTGVLTGLTDAVLNIEAGSGHNNLYINQAGSTVPDVLVITENTIQSVQAPFFISYAATGGDFGGQGAAVVADPFEGSIGLSLGSAADVVSLQGTPDYSFFIIDTGAGDDVVGVSVVPGPHAPNGRLDSVLGFASAVTIETGSGSNILEVNEAQATEEDCLFFTAEQLYPEDPAIGWTINYHATGGTFKEIRLFTGTADDMVSVRNVVALGSTNAPYYIHLGPGPDEINVFGINEQLGRVLGGPLFFDGGEGVNHMNVDQRNTTNGDIYTVTANQILGAGPLPFEINYAATGGSFEFVNLRTGSSDDWVRFHGTPAAPFNLTTHDGNDVIDVIGAAGQMGAILGGTLSADAGSGSNAFHFNQGGSGNGDIITVSAGHILGEGPLPFTIAYGATGGSFGGGVHLLLGSNDDWVRVQSQLPDSPLRIAVGPGNDRIDVTVHTASGYSNLFLYGGPGSNTLSLDEISGGATIDRSSTGPASGKVQVAYPGGGLLSEILFEDFQIFAGDLT